MWQIRIKNCNHQQIMLRISEIMKLLGYIYEYIINSAATKLLDDSAKVNHVGYLSWRLYNCKKF